ncbi:unnamed protein product [Cunninghamella echinulata]
MTIADQILYFIQSSTKKFHPNRNNVTKNETIHTTTTTSATTTTTDLANNINNNNNNNEHIPTTITIILDNNGLPTTKCIHPIHSPIKHYKKERFKNQPTPFKFIKYSSKIIPTSNNRLFQLPSELFIHIITYLNINDILTLSSTSSYCHQICGKKNNYLWHQLLSQHHHEQQLQQKIYQSRHYYQIYKDYTILKKRWQDGKAKSDYLTGHEDSVYCLIWINEHQVISGSRDKSIKLWDIQQKQCLATKHQHQGSVLCLTISKDKTFFISGSSDATLIYWSLPDMEPVKVMEGHLNGVLDCSIVNQRYIVSSSRDTTLRVWHVKDKENQIGTPYHRLVGHQGPVNALDAIPDTNYVISASGDATLKLWDCSTGQCLKTFVGHQRGLACVKYDLFSNVIISGGQDGKIKLWDIKSTDCLQTMTGHTDLIRTLDTYQGKIISGSYDRTLKVWNGLSGQCLLSIHSGHTSWIFNVLINDTKIISAGQDKKMMILNFGHDLLHL